MKKINLDDVTTFIGVVVLVIIAILGLITFTANAQEQIFLEDTHGAYDYSVIENDVPVIAQTVDSPPYRGEKSVDGSPLLSVMGITPTGFTWEQENLLHEVVSIEGRFYQTVSFILLVDTTRAPGCEDPYMSYFRLVPRENLGLYNMEFQEVAKAKFSRTPEGVILYGEIYNGGNIYNWTCALTSDLAIAPEGSFSLTVYDAGVRYTLVYANKSMQAWVNRPLLKRLLQE